MNRYLLTIRIEQEGFDMEMDRVTIEALTAADAVTIARVRFDERERTKDQGLRSSPFKIRIVDIEMQLVREGARP